MQVWLLKYPFKAVYHIETFPRLQRNLTLVETYLRLNFIAPIKAIIFLKSIIEQIEKRYLKGWDRGHGKEAPSSKVVIILARNCASIGLVCNVDLFIVYSKLSMAFWLYGNCNFQFVPA